jgi:hypothetical protein
LVFGLIALLLIVLVLFIDRPCTRIFVALILLVSCTHSVLKHCALRLHVRCAHYWLSLICTFAVLTPNCLCSLAHNTCPCVVALHYVLVCSLALCLYCPCLYYRHFVPRCLCTRAKALVWRHRDMCGPKGPKCVHVWDLKVLV